jgi:PAS domain S-box-containing protein
MAWIGWRDASTQIVQPVASFGDHDNYLSSIRIYADDRPEGRGPTGMSIRENSTYVCNDILADPNATPWGEAVAACGFRASVALPVRLSGNAVGALTVYVAEPGVFGDQEITLLEEAATDVSFALDNYEQDAHRKRVEEALKDSEQRLGLALQIAHIGAFEFDLGSGRGTFSPELARIWNLPPDFTGDLAAYFWAHMHPDDLPRTKESFTQFVECRQGGSMEFRIIRSDGKVRWVRWHGQVLQDSPSAPSRVVGVNMDITERKQAEEQLVLLNTAMLAAPNCVMITDESGIFEWVNPAFTKLTGYGFDEVIGKHSRILKSGHHLPEFYVKLWRTITDGESWQGEFVDKSKDGSLHIEDATIAPVRDSSGKIRHFVALMQDVTARKKSERHLRELIEVFDKANDAVIISDLGGRITYWNRGAERLTGWMSAEMIGKSVNELFEIGIVADNAEIRKAVATVGDWRGEVSGHNRNGDLVTIETSITLLRDESGHPAGRLSISTDITEKKKLADQFLRAQRLESIGMLAAGIAHDLNNVLAPIGMAAPLLRIHANQPGDLRLLDTLEKCAERGAGLVRQILGFAHGIEGIPQLMQVKHLFHDIIQVITETFPKSIVLDAKVTSDLWPIVGNPTLIYQVMLNLCVNARDAMPQGGILRLRAENCVLDATSAQAIAHAKPGSWLMLQVEDTGTGIAPEVLSKIWDPFFTTKSADKGTGLGLPTVRGIVATHHGFVELETLLGKGTTFRIYLPAAKPSVVDGVRVRLPSAEQGHQELILLVDDEELIRDTASSTLTNAGYQVVSTSDGVKAAELFASRSTEFELVITDLDMPNMDGESLARIIRLSRPALSILAMSGLSSGDTRQTPPAFATAFLSKPFTAEMLLNEVGRLLHKSPT